MTSRVSTHRYGRIVPAFAVVLTVACQAFAQTKIVAPRNSYSVAEDVKLGREASAEVRKELPMLNDSRVDEWAEDIGATLVRAIDPANRRFGAERGHRVRRVAAVNPEQVIRRR